MFLIYISNRYTNHQVNLCEAFNRLFDKFYFVETESCQDRVLPKGKRVELIPEYVVSYEHIDTIKGYITKADVVLVGSVSQELIECRLKMGLLTFKYSERICKKGIPWHKIPIRRIRYHYNYNRYSNYYLLCASAYSPYDFSLTNSFVNKYFKWGYFPHVYSKDIDEIMSHKNKSDAVRLLWVGRFIDWKHPEQALIVANELHLKHLKFSLDIVGFGQLKDELERQIKELGLVGCVRILGGKDPDEVQQLMKNSDIFLFTSDFNEGWGAVLNEAMANGCAVVASHAIGAVPYMLKNNENGMIYKNGDEKSLISCVLDLVNCEGKRHSLGCNAIKTVLAEWNAEEAARRFYLLSNSMTKEDKTMLFNSGPCSKADVIKNNWFD